MAKKKRLVQVTDSQLEFDYTSTAPSAKPPVQPKSGGARRAAPVGIASAKSVANKPVPSQVTKTSDADPSSYVDNQYSGPKAHLRPLYEKLINVIMKLGKDVRVVPGKTIVPIYRKSVIAQVKASTSTRIDLGLALGKQRATGRLIDTGGYGKGEKITHRISISTGADIDGEVRKWLETAYNSGE